MKNVLILGGTSDIGKEIAQQVLSFGWNVSITGRTASSLKKQIQTFPEHYRSKIEALPLNILDTQTHHKFVKSLQTLPDFVFCCIGYYEDQTEAKNNSDEFFKTIQTNFTGIAIFLNHLTNEMAERKYGKVVVLSSVAGIRGRQMNFIYGSAKAGLTAYLSGLRNLLFKSNVQITTILLGPVYTKMSAGHKLMPWITLQPKVAAKKIIEAGISGKDEIYIHWIWKYIMFAIRMIPEWMFKRLPPF